MNYIPDPIERGEARAEAGLCKTVKYDPEAHGELDAEPGSDIWWWGEKEEVGNG